MVAVGGGGGGGDGGGGGGGVYGGWGWKWWQRRLCLGMEVVVGGRLWLRLEAVVVGGNDDEMVAVDGGDGSVRGGEVVAGVST